MRRDVARLKTIFAPGICALGMVSLVKITTIKTITTR